MSPPHAPEPVPTVHPRGVVVVASLMVLFGVAEVVTGFRHEFFGLTTESTAGSTFVGSGIGLLYAAAGLLSFVRRRWSLRVLLVLLAAVVAGRVAMVVSGSYRLDSGRQTLAIITGTTIAASFGVYLWLQRAVFGHPRR